MKLENFPANPTFAALSIMSNGNKSTGQVYLVMRSEHVDVRMSLATMFSLRDCILPSDALAYGLWEQIKDIVSEPGQAAPGVTMDAKILNWSKELTELGDKIVLGEHTPKQTFSVNATVYHNKTSIAIENFVSPYIIETISPMHVNITSNKKRLKAAEFKLDDSIDGDTVFMQHPAIFYKRGDIVRFVASEEFEQPLEFGDYRVRVDFYMRDVALTYAERKEIKVDFKELVVPLTKSSCSCQDFTDWLVEEGYIEEFEVTVHDFGDPAGVALDL